MRISKTLTLPVALVALVSISGCAVPTTTTDGSRATLYSSVSQLSDDSDIVVVGHVGEQETARDIDDELEFTISKVHVDEIVKADGSLHVGDVVEVRQVGALPDPDADEISVPPTPLLDGGGTYLLYLTASGLPAPYDTQFYVTGANAGAYHGSSAFSRQAEETVTFEAVDPTEGEDLPAELTLDEAEAAAE
ncbi:hypothetical protein ELQ92_02280 [Labedella populi]|uniref:Uncharacterized protein n=1 Tax=Labedella populi TaxID=2498850 RepID=A0A444QEZ8_9MICO|nr:hypothetical protein [Labedella populi]RWZ68094.1 hypothetical protein ELQ92_02280 [Labedella populi]